MKGNEETMENLITSIFNDFNDLEDFQLQTRKKYAKIEAEEVIYENIRLKMRILFEYHSVSSSRIARSAVDKSRAKGIKLDF